MKLLGFLFIQSAKRFKINNKDELNREIIQTFYCGLPSNSKLLVQHFYCLFFGKHTYDRNSFPKLNVAISSSVFPCLHRFHTLSRNTIKRFKKGTFTYSKPTIEKVFCVSRRRTYEPRLRSKFSARPGRDPFWTFLAFSSLLQTSSVMTWPNLSSKVKPYTKSITLAPMILDLILCTPKFLEFELISKLLRKKTAPLLYIIVSQPPHN